LIAVFLGCATTPATRGISTDPFADDVALENPEYEPSCPEQTPAQPSRPDEPDRVALRFTTTSGRDITMQYMPVARSIGSATSGRLEEGRCLGPAGPGFLVRRPETACGTDETVILMMFALGEVLRDYPGTVPVVIGDLSRPEGGPLKPHKSHQSGRDIDIGLYAARNRSLSFFAELETGDVDWDKTFFLISNLIATGRILQIYANYSIQPHLYEAARAMGYDDSQLAWLFQYPRGHKVKAGVIRHAKGHTRHVHVRFSCPLTGNECLEH
jgi:hypothetical protein